MTSIHSGDITEFLKTTALETQQELTAGMNDEVKREFDRLLQISPDNIHAIRAGKE